MGGVAGERVGGCREEGKKQEKKEFGGERQEKGRQGGVGEGG